MGKILDDFLYDLTLNPWDRKKLCEEIHSELTQSKARIEALEGVVELQNSRKLAVDAIDFHKTEGCERCTSMFNDDTDTLYCEGLKRLEEKESDLYFELRNAFKKLEEV